MNWGIGFAILTVGLLVGTLFGQRLMLARQRWRELRRSINYATNSKSLMQLFAQTLEKRSTYEAAGLIHHVRIVNAVQFVVVWNWDLSTLLRLLTELRDPWSIEKGWQRKLHARTLALTMYESLIKLRDFFDRDWKRRWSLRQALRTLGVEDELSSELDSIHGRIVSTLATHNEVLEGVRKHVIGHRDQDVANQILWMKNADVDELESLGWELLKLTNDMLAIFTNLWSRLGARPAA